MITIMKANEMMPSWAMENCTPVVLAIMKVAAAVPGPPSTSAKVPMNSASSLRGKVTSAIATPQGLETLFGRAERCFAEVSASVAPLSIAARPLQVPTHQFGPGAEPGLRQDPAHVALHGTFGEDQPARDLP